MISPAKLLVAATITASAIGAGPAIAGACGFGHHGPPPPPSHHHHHHCPTSTTTPPSSSTTEGPTTTISL